MVFVVFDGENELLRKEIDEDYKANRPDLGEDNPFGQLALIRRGLSDCGIKTSKPRGLRRTILSRELCEQRRGR